MRVRLCIGIEIHHLECYLSTANKQAETMTFDVKQMDICETAAAKTDAVAFYFVEF